MKPPYPSPVTEWHNDTYDAINPKRTDLSQAGKNIVITGAGSGIGRETAHAFAEAGAHNIHILGRTRQSLEETQALVEAKHPNAKVIVHVADILDTASLDRAAKEIGCWDVLVANAGYMPKPSLIETSDPDEWWKAFEVLLLFLRYMLFENTNFGFNRSISKAITILLANFSHTRKRVAQSSRTQAVFLFCLLNSLSSQSTRRIPHPNWEPLASTSSWLSSTQT